ncbi:MAG: substrate-binding and VWA domain-containing protein [Anaerolineaceae bacterium]|nr:substrate-binding and VWA domain-containing protein [Anaerolineaceae bacterium]
MNFRRSLSFICLLTVLLLSANGCSTSQKRGKVLTVLAGSELNDLAPMLDEIQQNTGIRLTFQFTGTLDGAEQIMSGAKFDLAWFSHAKYLNLMEGSKDKVLAQEKIMLSPVVLGIKESKAHAWGWVDNPNLTWSDVVQKAASGDLHFAMTNPSSSNSGFSALIGVASALAGKGDALQKEDIASITPQLQGFFKGQSLTAGSSGWLAEQYITDQDQLDGMVNYESVLLAQNKSGKLKEKLYLVYPKEGIITADYPLLLLNPDKRDDYNKLVTYLKSTDFQREIMVKTLRRPVNSQVTLDADFPKQLLVEVSFPSSREVVDALLVSYLNEQVKPSHTYYVLDTSGSMNGDRLDNLVKAMDNLTGADTSLTGQFARFRNREKITILPFNSQVVTASDFEVDTNQPASLQQIRDYVHALNAGGSTAIFSALQNAYNLALQTYRQEPDRTYSIVLMTDGENNSGISENEFTGYYKSTPGLTNIRTFTILFGEADAKTLQSIADLTGGRMFDASKDSLPFIFKEIRGYQ